MGRHPDPLSSYRVSIHKIGKYLYASTQPIRFNEEKGKNEHYRIHWGTVSKDSQVPPAEPGAFHLSIIPNKQSNIIFKATDIKLSRISI